MHTIVRVANAPYMKGGVAVDIDKKAGTELEWSAEWFIPLDKWNSTNQIAFDSWLKSEAEKKENIVTMKESAFEAKICKEFREAGALVYKLPATGETSGLPDRLVIHRDWVGLLEFKAAGGELRANQRACLKQCQRRGFPAFVVEESAPTNSCLLYPTDELLAVGRGHLVNNGKAILDWLAVNATGDVCRRLWER